MCFFMVLVSVSTTFTSTFTNVPKPYVFVKEGQLQGRPGLAGAFWAQTEQRSGCGAASPSLGHRDPDSLRVLALFLQNVFFLSV